MKTYPCRPDQFSAKHILTFLKRDQHDQTLSINGHHVRKAISIDDQITILDLDLQDEAIVLNQVSNSDIEEDIIDDFILHWFDLKRDLKGFYSHLKRIPEGQVLFDNYRGFRILSMPTLLEALCWTVIGQQINFQFALELKRRFIQSFGQRCEELNVFPRLKDLKTITESDLIELKFGKFKSRYIMNIIEFLSQTDTQGFETMSNTELIKKLTSIKGIGEWSAQYVMMKFYHCVDIFPIKDVGLHNAIAKLNGSMQKPTQEKLVELMEIYGNYRGYIAQYLYLSLQYD